MDEGAFERWSQALEALRLARQDELEQLLQEKADAFKPTDFYQFAYRNIDVVMERWFSVEQDAPPPTSNKEMQNIKSEMESIFEFEVESVEREVAMITSRITWHPKDLEDARKSFLPLADEIKKKYQLKLKNLSPGEIKNPLPPEPLRTVQFSGSAGRSGGGLMSIVMLFIGLLLGGGVSIYFRDSERKAEARFQDEKQKMVNDQRALADSMSLLHASFADVVLGKSKPIPQLQAEMDAIQKTMDGKIYSVNAEAASSRAHLVKKIPAGSRLDRSLDDVERQRKRNVKAIEDEYKNSLRVYEKRILLYKDLLGDPQAPQPS